MPLPALLPRLRAAAVAGLVVAAFAVSPALADKRIALVVGNGQYVNASRLPNPPNDAHAMAEVLRRSGFEVTEARDADKATMSKAIDAFTERAYGADLAVFFYAGHGMQVDGRNYLIPVDAELTSPAHLKTRAVSIDDVIAALPTDPAVGVVNLDACRDNPLARTLASRLPASRSAGVASGLAPIQAQSTGAGTGGVLIAYATDPGAVALDGDGASNSPYTTALVRHLAQPGVEIQSALTRVRGDVAAATEGRQKPWHNASLGREVFVGAKPVAGATPAAPPVAVAALAPAAAPAASIEQHVWDEAARRNTADHYRAYLTQFPNGAFATMAKINIDTLERARTPAAAASTRPTPSEEARRTPGTKSTEDALALDQKGRIAIQQRLGLLGFDTGGTGGTLGDKSRRAIAGWQKTNGLPDTGWLTREQVALLEGQTEQEFRQARTSGAEEPVTRQAAPRNNTERPQKQRQTSSKQQGGGGMDEAAKAIGGAALAIGGGILVCKMAGRC